MSYLVFFNQDKFITRIAADDSDFESLNLHSKMNSFTKISISNSDFNLVKSGTVIPTTTDLVNVSFDNLVNRNWSEKEWNYEKKKYIEKYLTFINSDSDNLIINKYNLKSILNNLNNLNFDNLTFPVNFKSFEQWLTSINFDFAHIYQIP